LGEMGVVGWKTVRNHTLSGALTFACKPR
jgi:hypothetical protein